MNQPTPLQTLAARLALRRFHQRYPCPCADHHEWNADCERIAWCAVLKADTHCVSDDTPTPEMMAELLRDEIQDGHGTVLSESDCARVLYLARCAENALKRWWRGERRYYNRCVALVEQDEEGEWVAREIADARAWEALCLVEVQVDWELLLERLRSVLDEIEWAIVQNVLEGKTQAAIAQALGISPPSLHRRLRKIQEKARAIWGEIGEKGDESS